jgi:hypothetical protein
MTDVAVGVETADSVVAGWPKSVRLNRELRRNFVAAVVADVVPDSTEPTEEAFAERWGPKMYDMIYTPEIQAAMKACPKWMFVSTDYIYVSMGKPTGKRSSVLKFKCPIPGSLGIEEEKGDYGYSSHNADVGLPWLNDDHDCVIEYRDVSRQRADWRQKKSSLTSQLEGIVKVCNTTHQLFAAWPGALAYAEKCFPYAPPAPSQKGGVSPISAEELNLGIMFAKTIVNASVQA